MSIPLSMKFEGKKFMWDGRTYETQDQAQEAMTLYAKDGFEVQMHKNETNYLVYSRRVATLQTDA